MKKIAVLGPKGTYCDIACHNYINGRSDYEINYYPSIIKTAQGLKENDLAIIPFENTLDGFVVEGLDQIIANQYWINRQLKLDIDFAFVSNANSINEVKTCYCQFKAYGQCLDFITENGFSICTTESNVESLNLLNKSDSSYGAIIPMHLINRYKFNITKAHIADSRNNETRFVVISNDRHSLPESNNLEASIVIEAHEDRPGILYDILKQFHEANINLKSIMSRPLKTEMGKYKFYVECSINSKDLNSLNNVKSNIEKNNNSNVVILGIYDSI